MSMFTVTLTIDSLEASNPAEAIRSFQGAMTEVMLSYDIIEETDAGEIKKFSLDAQPYSE